jgi:exopolysaccharide biosynthesis polyprenyl glycosylphosphotransferase
MIHYRTRGLYRLLGATVVVILPLLFFLVTIVSADVLKRVNLEMVNLWAYLGGAAVAGLIGYHFYRDNNGLVARVEWAWRVTNLQTAILAAVMFGLVFATKDQAISRMMLASYILVTWFTLLALNLLAPPWLARLMFSGGNLRACLVIGSVESAMRLREWLTSTTEVGYEVMGQLTWHGGGEGQMPWPILGAVSELERAVRQLHINQVILLETRESPELVRRVASVCDAEGCRLLIYNPWAGIFAQPLIPVTESGHMFFMLREEPLENLLNRVNKRLLDLAISIPVVCLVLPVLIPIVWVGHRLQSRGPLFFKQNRRGFNKRDFVLYKFRTMHLESGQPIHESRQATKNDPRVFPFGEWLRRTSLDEVPQFFNVLRGAMSCVGPRPHLPEHDVLFHQYVEVYPMRHFAKPGITGLAQSLGYRGEITDVEVLRRRVRYDLDYISNWTLLLDIKIMFRTLGQVLRPPKTAY